jgi:hypothetical protein
MLNAFHYGALVFMIVCGGAAIYGIISLIKKWKVIPSGEHSKLLLQLFGVMSSGIVCFIVFLITGLFLDPSPEKAAVTENPNAAFSIQPENKKIHFNVVDEYTDEHLAEVQPFVEKFVRFCPTLAKHGDSIQSAQFSLVDNVKEDILYIEFGWTKKIILEIKIKDEANLPAEWDMNGQTLYYYLGSGRSPGVLLQTNQEHFFTGFHNTKISFIFYDGFSGIDTIGVPSIEERVWVIPTQYLMGNYEKSVQLFAPRYVGSWELVGETHAQLAINQYAAILITFNEKATPTITGASFVFDKAQFEADYTDIEIALAALIVFFEPYAENKHNLQLAKTLIAHEETMTLSMISGNEYMVFDDENGITSIVIFPKNI